MSAFFAAVLEALPGILAFVKTVWLAIEGDSKAAEDEAWSALSSILPAPWATSFEPFFRALWHNFDKLEEGWDWLTRWLKRGGVESANVLPWEGVEIESHLAADAWLDKHFASLPTQTSGFLSVDEGPTTDRAPAEAWGTEAELPTGVEVPHPGPGKS